MTAITDEQRRKVAARLRAAVGDVYGDGEIFDAEVLSILEIGVGPHEGYSDVDDILRLADLIDRPTCRMDLTATMATDCGDVRFWECSRCGGTHEEMGGRYERCPRCSAEVVR